MLPRRKQDKERNQMRTQKELRGFPRRQAVEATERNNGYEEFYGSYGSRSHNSEDFLKSPQKKRSPSYKNRRRRSDESVCHDVAEAIYLSPDLDSQDLAVEVDGGVVRLMGFVQNRHMKRAAQQVAESCSGVIAVENKIRIAQGMPANRQTQANGVPFSHRRILI